MDHQKYLQTQGTVLSTMQKLSKKEDLDNANTLLKSLVSAQISQAYLIDCLSGKIDNPIEFVSQFEIQEELAEIGKIACVMLNLFMSQQDSLKYLSVPLEDEKTNFVLLMKEGSI